MTTGEYLTVARVDDQERTWYEPFDAVVDAASQYNKLDNAKQWKWKLRGVPEYWTYAGSLTIGQIYKVTLTQKPNPGHNDYRDIRTAVPVETVPVGEGPVTSREAQREELQSKHEPYGEEHREPWNGPDVAVPRPNLVPPVEGVVKGHVENIAVRLYIAAVGFDNINIHNLEEIRQLRDRVYHQLTNLPIEPEHFCYTHNEVRAANESGRYAHKQEDVKGGWCWEGTTGTPESTGEPTPEGEA